MDSDVKPSRRYDSSGRQAQARQNRERIIDAAERQFLENGYGATTIASVAREARVSVETIYKAFAGKPGLVRGIYERRLEGRGTTAAYARSDAMRDRETDPREIMRQWGELTAEVASQVTPIRLLIRSAAATTPEMAALLAENDRERLQRMRHHARFLAQRGYLAPGVTVAQATDVMWVCSSAELYEQLVLQRGWSRRRFGRFVADFMIGNLLA